MGCFREIIDATKMAMEVPLRAEGQKISLMKVENQSLYHAWQPGPFLEDRHGQINAC